MSVSLDVIIEAVESGANLGFCTNCGNQACGIEPNTRNMECEVCENYTVFGAEELLIAAAIASSIFGSGE